MSIHIAYDCISNTVPHLCSSQEGVTFCVCLERMILFSGRYYVLVFAYGDVTDLTIMAAAPDSIRTLSSGVALTGLSGASGDKSFYKIQVPEGANYLQIRTNGVTGDCDLYVKFGERPGISAFDYKSSGVNSRERIDISNPQQGKP